MATASSAPPVARPSSVWLFGAVPDFLLGAGLLYLLSVPLLLILAPRVGLETWPFWAVWAVPALASAPHYGATVLRVYERRDERRRYAVFTVWITLALIAAAAAAFHVPWVGSLLVTAYVTWSPWHFSGQNYGVSLMFLRRRGVDVQPAKRLLYASFLLSFALSFIAIHVEASTAAYTVPVNVAAGNFNLVRLGIPRWIAHPLFVATAGVYLAVTVAALRRLRGKAPLAALVPAILLILTQSLWFVVPAWLDLNGLRQGQGLIFATIWINVGHSLQYLWVTSYYDRALQPSRATPRYLLQVLLIGNAILVVPGLVFAPFLLGNVAWDRGLAILVAAIVNLHHFILDGAIWKLRDGRVARALLRDSPAAAAAAPPISPSTGGPRFGLGILVAAVGAVCLGAQVDELLLERKLREEQTEPTRAALDRLSWFGRDYTRARLRIGGDLLRSGRYEEALAEYERTLAIAPSVVGYRGRGLAQQQLGNPAAAAESFRAGLALEPTNPKLLRDLARAEKTAPASNAPRESQRPGGELPPEASR